LALAATSAEKTPVCPADPPNIPAFTAEAESGNPHAQLELGDAYLDTKEAEKVSQPAYWFERVLTLWNSY
jgi:hypothetical protein